MNDWSRKKTRNSVLIVVCVIIQFPLTFGCCASNARHATCASIGGWNFPFRVNVTLSDYNLAYAHTRIHTHGALTEREADTYEREAYIPHSQIQRTVWDSKDIYPSSSISPLASRLFVPEESAALTLFQLSIQWQLFSIRGLVSSNGAAALWQILMGDIGSNGKATACGAQICLKFQSERSVMEGSSAWARWPKPRCDLSIRHVQEPIRLSHSRLVKSRRPDPPEITLVFPFFGSFIGSARDKRVRRVADLTSDGWPDGTIVRRALRVTALAELAYSKTDDLLRC